MLTANSRQELESHGCDDAAVYQRVVEGQGRGVIAVLRLGSELSAFSNRIGLLPPQIIYNTHKLLDIGDRRKPVSFTGREGIQDHAGEHSVPDFFAS